MKRDFTLTQKPKEAGTSKGSNLYVIQKHHSRRLHWDFRLERDGVLKSWAVPKEIPEKSGIRRLAIMVEDHPLEYGGFEGTIQEGEYGAGTVEIWDTGVYARGAHSSYTREGGSVRSPPMVKCYAPKTNLRSFSPFDFQ